MIQPKKSSPNKRHYGLIGFILAVIVVAILMFLPTGKYVEVPGTAESLKPYVKMAGVKDNQKGSYMLVTVGVIGPATPVELVWGKMQPYSEVLSKSELMGNDNSAEYNLLQRYYIESAGSNAIIAAFKAAKHPVDVDQLGVYVMSLLKNSPFKKQLKLGDTITALNGRHYNSAEGYVKAVQQHHVGDDLTLTYTRKGKVHHATQKLMKLPETGKPGIGITLTEHIKVRTDPKVTINAGEIGGPSAGLMFSVQTYTMLTHQNWRSGRNIAGTGTIDASGTVGQIGGIDKKVYIANKEGAKVFFAPDMPATKAILKLDPTYQNNYAVAVKTARQIKTKMKIIPVKKLSDALTYLKTHQEN